MPNNTRDGYGFGLGGPLPALSPTPVISQRVPATTDTNFELGTTWINTATNQAWTMTGSAAGAATWSLSSPGASDVDTINGLSPVAGNMIIDGGTNVTDTNAGNTVTLNLDNAITLATSVTSPIYTAAAALDINAAAGQNITLQMGDAVGANIVEFEDSTSAAVATMDSAGTLTVVNMDGIIGATTPAAITGTTIVANTSVSSPDYIAPAGTDTTITATAGQDIDILMGDAAGANEISFQTNAGAPVSTMDSVGTLTVVNMDGIIGATTPAAGTFTTVAGNTSVASPLITSIGATDTLITAQAGEDIIFRMGDAVGGNFVRFQSSTPADVVTMDSTGVLSALAGLNVAGAFAQTAGQFDVGQDNAANAINIGGGTTARAIGIGNSAAAHTITMGTVTGAASLDLLAGTGNFTLEGNVATTYAISNTGVNTGQVDIAGGTGARTINIGGGGTGAKTIGIGAAASADVITIGDATGAGSLDLACGTGNFTLEGNVATTYAISNTGINTGQVDIAGGTGARTINIGGGGTGAKTINIGGAASADVITIGDATGAGSLDLVCGTGNLTLTSTGAGDILIDSDDTFLVDADGVLELNSTGGIIGIGSDADAQNINIGTGAAARVITVGNITGATQVVLNSGTAGVNINTTGAGDVVIDSDDTFLVDADGVLELNSSAGVIGIGNDADAQNINIGTGAAARVITLGNVTGATSVVVDAGTGAASFGASATAHTTTLGSVTGAADTIIQSGTGDITMTGTIKEATTEFVTRSGDYITFEASPLGQSNAVTGADPTGANTDLNLLSFQEGMIMEQYIIGTQAIIVPRMDATGLLASLDLTATDGWELNYGAARANSRHSFTIGTDAAFFFELRFTLADISGCEPFYFGFRITQANNVAYANYTDFAAYGVNNLVAANDCIIATNLNAGGINTTDTNDAFGDGTTHTLQVLVSAAGVVTFTFDGAPPTATQAFTFDNGDVVHPFIHNLFGAAAPGNIHFHWLKIGYQA